jgi:flagellar FliJ protein
MSALLQTLLEQAERQRDGLLQALQQARQHQGLMAQQAEQLRSYQAETRARGPLSGRSAGVEVLHLHTGFMQRLDQALLQQGGTLRAAEERCQRLQALLLAAEQRVAGVRRLQERRAQATHALQSRREQRGADEAAAQRHWARRSGLDSAG